MRRYGSIMLILSILAACASIPRYDAPFAEIDRDRDALIEWREFESVYPGADPKAFLEADANKNGGITLEEWLLYQKNHGS